MDASLNAWTGRPTHATPALVAAVTDDDKTKKVNATISERRHLRCLFALYTQKKKKKKRKETDAGWPLPAVSIETEESRPFSPLSASRPFNFGLPPAASCSAA